MEQINEIEYDEHNIRILADKLCYDLYRKGELKNILHKHTCNILWQIIEELREQDPHNTQTARKIINRIILEGENG